MMNDKLDEILDLLRSQNDINPNRKYDREQKTYARRPSNKACPNYEYGDDNFENRKRCLKKKNTR